MTNIRKSFDNTEIGSKYAAFLKQNLIQIDHKEFVCGWGAAFINITVTYPIYKIIFRQVCVAFPQHLYGLIKIFDCLRCFMELRYDRLYIKYEKKALGFFIVEYFHRWHREHCHFR